MICTRWPTCSEAAVGSFNVRLYFSADRPEAFVMMSGGTCDQLPAPVITGLLAAAGRGEIRCRRVDVAFLFNSANAPFLPLLRARRLYAVICV